MTDTGTVASEHDVVWEEWRALIRARRDGQVSEAEYRRAVAGLRSRLDLLPQDDPDPVPAAWSPPPTAPAPDLAVPPAAVGPSTVLTLVVIVAVLAAAVGFALVSVAV